jgi:transposase-like protein
MKWPFSFSAIFSRKPAGPLSPTQCPQCGREMVFVEKFTMTGDDLRTFRCEHCQQEHIVNFGTAMWKLLSDANKSADDTD